MRHFTPTTRCGTHAATWIHNTGGLEWEDVSVDLGHHSSSFTRTVYVRSRANVEVRNRRGYSTCVPAFVS